MTKPVKYQYHGHQCIQFLNSHTNFGDKNSLNNLIKLYVYKQGIGKLFNMFSKPHDEQGLAGAQYGSRAVV